MESLIAMMKLMDKPFLALEKNFHFTQDLIIGRLWFLEFCKRPD
ncbi:MAG: hypothetical protein ACP5IN_00565 [Caldimicrobium sp.]|jgi:hypothetical protein